jgi:hypothetical protein
MRIKHRDSFSVTNAYFIDDAGDWEADGVTVNPTGTASLNVQVTDASDNPVASQNVYQAHGCDCSGYVNLMLE